MGPPFVPSPINPYAPDVAYDPVPDAAAAYRMRAVTFGMFDGNVVELRMAESWMSHPVEERLGGRVDERLWPVMTIHLILAYKAEIAEVELVLRGAREFSGRGACYVNGVDVAFDEAGVLVTLREWGEVRCHELHWRPVSIVTTPYTEGPYVGIRRTVPVSPETTPLFLRRLAAWTPDRREGGLPPPAPGEEGR